MLCGAIPHTETPGPIFEKHIAIAHCIFNKNEKKKSDVNEKAIDWR
jgi:hypothetical protein